MNRVFDRFLRGVTDLIGDQEGGSESSKTIYLVDDNQDTCETVQLAANQIGVQTKFFGDMQSYLSAGEPTRPACLLLNHRLLHSEGEPISRYTRDSAVTVVLCDDPDVSTVVRYMRAGALSILTPPLDPAELCQLIEEAFACDAERYAVTKQIQSIAEIYANLPDRQRKILHFVLDGKANKWIANELDVSRRTVELDRAEIIAAFHVANSIELAKTFAEYLAFCKSQEPVNMPEKQPGRMEASHFASPAAIPAAPAGRGAAPMSQRCGV